MIATIDATPHPPPSPARVWFGIVGAPAAWAGQGLLAWFVSGAGCETGAAGWFTPATAHVLEIGISAAMLAIAAAALAAGYGAWRESAESGIARVQGRARPDFLAATAVLVSFVFVTAIVLTAIPQFILPMCEAAR